MVARIQGKKKKRERKDEFLCFCMQDVVTRSVPVYVADTERI